MPFHGQDAWRRHPLFARLWVDPLPGFKYAVVVFGSYVILEYTYRVTNYYINAPPPEINKGKKVTTHHGGH